MSEGKRVDKTHAQVPSGDSMQGRYVRLDRYSPESHLADLWRHYTVDDSTWALLPGNPPAHQEKFAGVMKMIEDEGNIIFVMMANPNNLGPGKDGEDAGLEALGTVICGDINKEYRTIEAGAIFGPAVRRSPAATESHFLLLRNIFEPKQGPGYRRVAWKTNVLNKKSQRAAERMGYVYEGTWRNHMIINGVSRDSCWYSMIDDDWPRISDAFEQWLQPSNFDQDGKQKRALQEIRDSLPQPVAKEQ